MQSTKSKYFFSLETIIKFAKIYTFTSKINSAVALSTAAKHNYSKTNYLTNKVDDGTLYCKTMSC